MREAEVLLLQRYRESRDITARDELVASHMGLVHHIARSIATRLPAGIELDDLVNAGAIGLLAAIESFDPSRSLAFSTYATPRIRGAILDDLRIRDWVPRSVRSRHRKLTATRAQLRTILGRPATAEEMAEAMQVELNTYYRWVEEIENAVLLSFDAVVETNDHDTVSLGETLADGEALQPDAAVTDAEEVQILRQAIGELPPRERTVLALYYYEELNLREIAEVLEVTESRISQIRSRALQQLREIVRAQQVA